MGNIGGEKQPSRCPSGEGVGQLEERHEVPRRTWRIVLDDSISPDIKLVELIDHGVALCMRQASEPSFQKLASLYAVCTEGLDRARVMGKESLAILF